ncbi:MAG: DUF493 family protein [Bacteroidetes bacterium]|jgi:putative lipoic acid-binding regulatory protein|nr:DUF493 family protein [Bacteroidota bacterium]
MEEPNFDELRKKLEKDSWPAVYLFKFIVPSDNQKIAQVESFFEDDSEIKIQASSNGKYTSISIRQVMLSPEAIIEVYKKAYVIEGIISL